MYLQVIESSCCTCGIESQEGNFIEYGVRLTPTVKLNCGDVQEDNHSNCSLRLNQSLPIKLARCIRQGI